MISPAAQIPDETLGPLFTEIPIGQQLEFYRSPAQTRLIIGGNRIGKTSAGGRETAWWMDGSHPYRDVPPAGAKGWIITETREIANEIIIPKLLYYLPKHGPGAIEKFDPGSDQRPASIVTKNTSRVLIRTFGQGRARFQGDKLDFVWADEEMPHDIYKECQMRLVDLAGAFWLTMTPLLGKTWVYTHIFLPWDTFAASRKAIDCFAWSMWDNPYLTRDAIETALAQVDDPAERESREHGTFTDRSGLIFKQFDPRVHMIDDFAYPRSWPVVLGLDPGYRHPTGGSLQVESPQGDRIIIGELHFQGKDVARMAQALFTLVDKRAPHLIKSRRLEKVLRSNQIAVRRMEPTFRGLTIARDPSSKSYGVELTNYGIHSKPGNREMLPGLTRIGTMLANAAAGRSPGLYLVRGHTTHHVDEFGTYVWKEPDGKEAKPMDVNDDTMDACRYGVMQQLSAKVYSLASQTQSFFNRWARTGGNFADAEEIWANTEADEQDETSIGEWLAFAEKERAGLAHKRGRKYSDEDIMNHLEEQRGRRFGVGVHALRRMKASWK